MAERIVDAFTNTVKAIAAYDREHPEDRAERVEWVAFLPERAFGCG